MSNHDNDHLSRFDGFDGRRQLYKLEHERGMPSLLAMAKREISDRAVRKKVLKIDISHDAAWDMLLSLFVARYGGAKVSSTTLAHTVEVPVTTALRYINYLESKRLVEKYDVDDLRVTAVRLTEVGFERLAEYFVQKVVTAP